MIEIYWGMSGDDVTNNSWFSFDFICNLNYLPEDQKR